MKGFPLDQGKEGKDPAAVLVPWEDREKHLALGSI